MSDVCKHGNSLFQDWCSGCNGSPGSNNPPPPKKKVDKRSRPKTLRTMITRIDDVGLKAMWDLRTYATNNKHDHKLVREAIVERIKLIRRKRG